MTKSSVIEVLRDSTEEALSKYKARIRGIFGSYARGEESGASDIDILVDFSEDADLFDFVGLALYLEERLHRPVDVVPVDTIRSEVRSAILNEAIYL